MLQLRITLKISSAPGPHPPEEPSYNKEILGEVSLNHLPHPTLVLEIFKKIANMLKAGDLKKSNWGGRNARK